MSNHSLRKKTGIVFVLDALGASSYSDSKIKKFLSARKSLNKILIDQAKILNSHAALRSPNTYTFGDTLIVAIPLSSKPKMRAHITGALLLMQNYMYNSFREGILFRGAFSIGEYIEDQESNTVMGEAISDAAAWYEKSEWMGLSSTPKANNEIEFLMSNDEHNPMFWLKYPVPMKDGRKIDLYTVSWAGRFFHKSDEIKNPNKEFLDILRKQNIPLGAEQKIENTKNYFYHVEKSIKGNT